MLGLARSGLATVEALVASGARGDGLGRRARRRGRTRRPALAVAELADPLEIDLAGYDGVVVSPGVPLNTHPIAAKAREAGVPVIGDIELFAQARAALPPHKVVGITGTNGKSTTTALVHHILKTAGVPTTMGGNIGLPILAQDPLPEGGVYVLELSSYQIDLTYSLDCDVAVLLNVTPDHLDRYESFEAYAASQGAAVRNAVGGRTSPSIVTWTTASMSRAGHAVWPSSTDLVMTGLGESGSVTVAGACRVRTMPQNAAAAIAACGALGLAEEADRAGPAHLSRPAAPDGAGARSGTASSSSTTARRPTRIRPRRRWRPIRTSTGSSAGWRRREDLGPCAEQLDHVRAAYTIGEAGPMFARLLEDRVPVRAVGVLETAVKDAAEAAVAGEVVLLSPACASFDQFTDYEARGQAFRDAVEALA